MSDIENTAEVTLNEDDIQAICTALQDGFTPAQTAGTDQKQLEALYSLGHSFFSSGQYKDAQTIFQSLCLFDYRDERYWMGLGACLQAQDKLDMAAEVYGMAALTTSLGDPTPLYYASLCQLKNDDLESADATLTAIKLIGNPGDPKHDAIYAKANNLHEIVKERMAGVASSQGGSPKEVGQ
ncbi:MAG: SycD/LcrH family type III secretion system chaperone [Deltaproteobacteria bacterium]|jgi:type III secretion system low calcium response chaperone LcrH/SycD|nr:SycD/LcrH family type III secretion system chaperone [Deltaproteobacteria bacterium]